MSEAPYEVLAGRYELHRQLATGGTADVFLARDQLLNRPVAVKVLSAELSEDEAFVERLRREAQLVASLNHQNIVGVFDQGEEDGAPFIVMEYVDGRSLGDVLRSEGRLHPDRAATIAVDVAAALDAAHRQGMVHMDVKPGNVLITPEGQVKLADFGIAKALNEGQETDLTAEGGTVMGTATYLSPEQAQGQKVGPRSDVYSLATVLYEMMTGRPPFIGDSPVEIARKHVDEAPQRPSRLGVEIAQSLEAITLKGLAKSPVNRYPSVRDFAADLKRYLGGAHNLTGHDAAQPAAAPRPTTGRSTAPEPGLDATVIIPAASPSPQQSQPAQQEPATITQTPAAEPQQQAVAAAAPQPTPQPVGQRPDDTWKRNVTFFITLLLLLVLLAFLVKSFLDLLRTDDTDPVTSTDPVAEETVVVGNYVGRERDQAISFINQLDLEYEVEFQPNSEVESGRVFLQDPPAGRKVAPGTLIILTVSEAEGRVKVPGVVTLPREEAVRQLARLGFQAQITEVDSEDFPAGEVISQNPFTDELAERGSPVQLQVSLGPPERTIPDLAGSTLSEALAEVFDLDFRYIETQEADPEVEQGLVLRTEPPAGELLRGGETLTIVVSSGVARATVPSVVGLLADSARQQLVSSKFTVKLEFESTTDETQINKVLAQSPPANQEVEEGGEVRIVVGQAPPPEETTTTTTTTTTTSTTTTTAAP